MRLRVGAAMLALLASTGLSSLVAARADETVRIAYIDPLS